MKRLIIILMLFAAIRTHAQRHVAIVYKTDSLKVLLGENNSDKVLIIKRDTSSSARFIIKVEEWAQERNMNRRFSFVGDNGNPALDIEEGNILGEYAISIKELSAKLNNNNTYTLYTIALPKDPAIAATIRVRRLLVCKINLQ